MLREENFVDYRIRLDNLSFEDLDRLLLKANQFRQRIEVVKEEKRRLNFLQMYVNNYFLKEDPTTFNVIYVSGTCKIDNNLYLIGKVGSYNVQDKKLSLNVGEYRYPEGLLRNVLCSEREVDSYFDGYQAILEEELGERFKNFVGRAEQCQSTYV